MEKPDRINVTLYPEDFDIVDAADTANVGRSGTIRRIIREWHAMKKKPANTIVDTPIPYLIPVYGRCPTCQHRAAFTFVGIQEDGDGGQFPLWNCSRCGSTVNGNKIEREIEEQGEHG